MKKQTYITFLLLQFIQSTLMSAPDTDTTTKDLSHAALFEPNTTFPYFEKQINLTSAPDAYLLNAAFLSQCSLLVYVTDKTFIETSLKKAGFEHVNYFDNNGAFAFLAEDEQNRILIFRGTEQDDLRDIKVNLRTRLVQLDERGSVHRGFKKALEGIETSINTELNKRESEKKKTLWVAGHSQGGALATLWAIKNLNRAETIVTIGAPRISDIALTEACTETLPLLRFVNDNDSVPRIPISLYYRHIGKTYFIDSDGELNIEPSNFSLFKATMSGFGRYQSEVFIDLLAKGRFHSNPHRSPS